MDHIDGDGFRANVGIILSDARGRLLVGGRVGQDAWQFPQGGMQVNEAPLASMYRELREEIGLGPEDVRLLGHTADWLRYRLPEQYVRRRMRPVCIGQKQRWFLLGLQADETRLRLDATASPEFDRWRWVEFWDPVREVIYFKRDVYRQALVELGPLIFPGGLPPEPDWMRSELRGLTHG